MRRETVATVSNEIMEELYYIIIIMVAVIVSLCAILYGGFLLLRCCRYMAARKKNRVLPFAITHDIDLELPASAVKSFSTGLQLPQPTSLGWLRSDDLVEIDV